MTKGFIQRKHRGLCLFPEPSIISSNNECKAAGTKIWHLWVTSAIGLYHKFRAFLATIRVNSYCGRISCPKIRIFRGVPICGTGVVSPFCFCFVFVVRYIPYIPYKKKYVPKRPLPERKELSFWRWLFKLEFGNNWYQLLLSCWGITDSAYVIWSLEWKKFFRPRVNNYHCVRLSSEN